MFPFIGQVDLNYAIVNPIIAICVIIGFVTIIWRIAVTHTKHETSIKNLGIQHTQDLINMESKLSVIDKKISDVENSINLQFKELEKWVADSLNKDKLEWKEEVKNALLTTTNKFQEQHEALNSIRSELKDVNNRVTIVDTIVKGHTMALKAIHKRIKETQDFFTKWIQRVEDRIETAQNRSVQMVKDAIHEVMGQMNMLINMSRRSSR